MKLNLFSPGFAVQKNYLNKNSGTALGVRGTADIVQVDRDALEGIGTPGDPINTQAFLLTRGVNTEHFNQEGYMTTKGANTVAGAYDVLKGSQNPNWFVIMGNSKERIGLLKTLPTALEATANQQEAIANREARMLQQDAICNGTDMVHGLPTALERTLPSERAMLGGTLLSEAMQNRAMAKKAQQVQSLF